MSRDPFVGYDHVQLLCPAGREAEARAFWSDVVGLREVEKPEPLRRRGGAWFRCGEHGLHVGAEDDFVPAVRAHPALRLRDEAAYEGLAQRLREAGYPVLDADPPISTRRMKSRDPFGNMVEFVLGTTG